MEDTGQDLLQGILSVFQSPISLSIFIVFTLAFIMTVLLILNKDAGKFIAGMIPFFTPKDEKGQPIKRAPAQWAGMCILIALVVFAVVY